MECSGLSCRKGVSGRHGSLDAAIDSNVSGHSSSSSGMERTISTVWRLGLAPRLLNVSFVGLEKIWKLNGPVFFDGWGSMDGVGWVDLCCMLVSECFARLLMAVWTGFV